MIRIAGAALIAVGVLALAPACAQTETNQDTRVWLEKLCGSMAKPTEATANFALPPMTNDDLRDQAALVGFYQTVTDAYDLALGEMRGLAPAPRDDAEQFRTAVIHEFEQLHVGYNATAAAAHSYANNIDVFAAAQDNLKNERAQAEEIRKTEVERIDKIDDLDQVRRYAQPCHRLGL